MQCVYAVDELKASLKDLQQQKLDNIIDDFGALESWSNAITSRAEAMSKYLTSAGDVVNSGKAKQQLEIERWEAKQMFTRTEEELKVYAKEMANAKKLYDEFGEGSNEYHEALAQYEELNQKLIENKALYNDLNRQLLDLDITKLDYAIDRIKQFGDKLASIVSLKNTRGTKYGDASSPIFESDYSRQADLNNQVISMLMEQRQKNIDKIAAMGDDIDSEHYKEAYDAIMQAEQEVFKLIESNEELKKSIRELRWKPFKDLQEELTNVIEDYDHLRSLIKDAQMFDEDDGILMTSRGYAALAMLAQQLNTAKKQIADYREALNKLDKEYKNGNISLEEYNEQSREYVKVVQQSVTQTEGYKDSIADLYKTQIQNENKALNDLIGKRKEALQAKKAYYDYDKQLRSENKDILNLRAQINALQGVNVCPIYLIAGTPLESYRLKHKDETCLSVNAKNYKNWAISSRVPNRERFNDQIR